MTRQPPPGRPGRHDAGISAVETVLLTPLLAVFVVLVAGLGLLVNARADISGAARDAARAGALERSHAAAVTAATTVAGDTLDGLCAATALTSIGGPGQFQPGGMFTVQITCQVNTSFAAGLLGSTTTITARAAAPLDTLRRVG